MHDIGVPELPSAAHVVDVVVENHRTRTFTLDVHLPGARPGQFVMVWLPGRDEKPISLMGSDPVRLTVAAVGPFTRAMHALRPGDRVWLRGPFGNGFSLDGVLNDSRGLCEPPESPDGARKPRRSGDVASWTHRGSLSELSGQIESPLDGDRIVLVGGGYGVAPLHFLACLAVARGVHVTAIVGARTRSELLFEERFRSLGVDLLVTTDDGSHGSRGLATDPLEAMCLDGVRPDQVYACGPEPMLEAVKGLCLEHVVPAQLSWARVMRCAMGICGTCDRSGWLVCRDGPVERVA